VVEKVKAKKRKKPDGPSPAFAGFARLHGPAEIAAEADKQLLLIKSSASIEKAAAAAQREHAIIAQREQIEEPSLVAPPAPPVVEGPTAAASSGMYHEYETPVGDPKIDHVCFVTVCPCVTVMP
jgi:hypothetical protein